MPRKRTVNALLPPGSAPGAKATLLSIDQLDGRTVSAKRARALIDAITADLGDDLSAAQTVLVRRVATATAIAEHLETLWLAGHPIDIPALTTLANTISRVCGQLGLKRVARDVTPTIRDVIASIAAEKQAAQVAVPDREVSILPPSPPLPPVQP
jgi:hypothetical protein